METPADYLREHQFQPMFTELLGWEHAAGTIRVSASDRHFTFTIIAHKRGLQVLHSSTDHLAIINRGLLRSVQRIVAKTCHEHILIFSCPQPRKQVWQWAIKMPDGRKLRHREHPFFSNSPPAPFLHRLSGLGFTLDEEDNVTLIDALDRVRRTLDTCADLNLFVRRPWYAERSDALFKAVQSGSVSAIHEFLLFHLPLARKVSRRLCRWFGMLPEDAEQIAFLGLMKAARGFRPELGYQFSTYATMSIKRACQRFGPEVAFLIRLPSYLVWPCFRLRFTLDGMVAAVGSAGVKEYLTELDLRDPKTGRQLRDFERATVVRSLSDRKETAYQAAREIVERQSTPVDDAKRAEIAARVQKAVDRLHPRQAQILRLRYGFDGCPPQTLEEIGQLFSVTRERVRQIQARAEETLRKVLVNELGDHELLVSREEQARVPGPELTAHGIANDLEETRQRTQLV